MGKEIIFISKVDGLDTVQELLPYKSKLYKPSWYKKVPRLFEGQKTFMPGGPVKRCPSYKDWFGSGYIVPNWCEAMLQNDGINWEWNTSLKDFQWEIHDNKQYVDFLPKDAGVNAVYKAICPWKIVTPKGWSVMQLPLYYDYNNDWEVLPGIIHTDTHHEVNPQVALMGDKEVINIKAGQPFFRLVPFKRDTLDLKIYGLGKAPSKLQKKIDERHIRLMTSFRGSYEKNIRLGK